MALPTSRQDVTLQLSQPECMGYDAVIEETRRKFDSLVSIGDRTTNELFKAIVKMRMLCNQRTFNYSKLNNLSNLEEGCQRCLQRDADSTLLWKSSSSCPDCGRPLHKTRGNPGQTNSRSENKSESNSYIQNVEAGPFLVPTYCRDLRLKSSSQRSSLRWSRMVAQWAGKLEANKFLIATERY